MAEEMDGKSVTVWIDEARVGNEQARFKLWSRYFQRLLSLARSRLSDRVRRFQDEEDVVSQAFHSLFEAMQREGFKDQANRDDIWRLLVRITENKIKDLAKAVQAEKRGGGKVRGHSVLLRHADDRPGGFGDIPDPTPEFAEQFGLTLAESLEKLNPEQIEITQLRMLGYTNLEISEKLGKSEEAVRRKVQLIREKWDKD